MFRQNSGGNSAFFWLAFRSVDLNELWADIQSVTFYWLPFFTMALLFSHYARAERWKLFLPDQANKVHRSTLFAGVMLGYLINYFVPRLGEISRPAYVAKKTGLSSGNLIGTIIAERLVDLFVLLILIVGAIVIFSSRPGVIENLFGVDGWRWFHYMIIPFIIGLTVAMIWGFRKIIIRIEKKGNIKSPVLSKLVKAGLSFSDGMVSLKKIESWPKFILLTACIWFGYVLMTFIPFYMLDLQITYNLDMLDAVVLTIVSSVGVSIPTPAGIGSYHLLMQQGMNLLFDVPLSTGLTYATVLHIVNFVVILVFGPLSLWWDKYYTLVSE